MIATHNIKVNGRWIMAGEEYSEAPELKEIEKAVEQISEPEVPTLEVPEEPKTEPKPKTTRRKTNK